MASRRQGLLFERRYLYSASGTIGFTEGEVR